MIANFDVATGIHFGCISQNSIDPFVLDDLIQDSDDLLYNQAMDDVRDDLRDAVQKVLEKYDLQDDVDVDEMDFDVVLDAANESYMNDNHQYYYKSDEYEFDFSDDMNCIIICKSPYYTYCKGCSPCLPNAGDIDEPVSKEEFDNDKRSAYHSTKKAYCLPDDYFEGEKAPYEYFSVRYQNG